MQALLANLLGAALDAAVEALEEPNTEEGPPDRRYVSHGDPAADCAQLVVYAQPVRLIQQQGGAGCTVVPVVRIGVVLHRCVTAVDPGPVSAPPTAEVLDTEARALAVDGWALLRGILTARRSGVFAADTASVDVGPLEPIAPAGGIAGWRLTIEVQGPAAVAAGS